MPDDNSSDSQSNATPGRIPNQADWLGLQPPVRLSPEEQTVIDTDPATFVALQIMEGYNAQQIIAKLELAGVSRERADELVSALRSPEVKRYRKSAANKTLLTGGAALVAGIACNLFLTAFIGIPLVLAGGVCLVVGLRQRLSA